MRRIRKLVLAALMLLIATQALAGGNHPKRAEPPGVLDFAWGQPIPVGQNLRPEASDGRTLWYSRRNETIRLGNADIQRAFYGFYDNRFFAALLTFQGLTQFRRLVFALETQYGSADQRDNFRKIYRWIWPRVTITLSLKGRARHGEIFYQFLPIANQRQKRRSGRPPGGYAPY